MHLYGGKGSDFYLKRMKENNVQWAGAVGGGPKDSPLDIKSALSQKYIAALGQTEFFAVFYSAGEGALYDLSNPIFQVLFDQAEQAFRAGVVRGFGEIHINNISPFSPARGQRKIDLTSPVVLKMFEISQKYDGFVQIHTMSNSGFDQLLSVSAKYPRVRLILAHCLPGATADEIEELFKKRPNLICDLSATGPIHRNQRVYSSSGPKKNWIDLIEKYPTRFMVGTDPCCGLDDQYFELVSEIREHLLPYLKEPTLRAVANGNARRIFGLR
jgi:predicted TIM-barrel fold metal-dependent hydrolase